MSAATVRRLVPALLLLAAVPLLAQPAPPIPRPAGTRLQGLHQPVEILRDRWGIAHIYAQNEDDLFFAQGYSAARDRLFQFELWRRQATGTLAEVVGRRELTRDIGARLHMFRGDLKKELAAYHPRGEAIVSAFVQGVNAYIARTEQDPTLLPIEFSLLGIRPGRWTPAVVISRHQGLLGTGPEVEIDYAKAVQALGVARVKALSYFQGGDPNLDVDPAIDVSLLDGRILDLYTAFRKPVQFQPSDIVPAARGDAAAFEALVAASAPASADEARQRARDIGSNNWVVSGARTQSGFPILANDPHRPITVPSLRYWVHLVAPGWNVIGAGEPVLPGVSIGHNEHGAWGLTIFGNDTGDLYVYDTNPARPRQYRYGTGWEEMTVVADRIGVKGEAPVAVEYKFTRHGPVLYEDTAHHKAYALRAAWMDIGNAPYMASLSMDQAASWAEFRQAAAKNFTPSENMVWVDRSGTIGWQAAGIQPLRRNWSGLVPVPGDGRYEWSGYLPVLELPSRTNPDTGFVATANHYLMPPDFKYPEAMHYTWTDPYRASRITEVLASGRLFSIAEMARLQNDNLSIVARGLVPLLRDLAIVDATTAEARARLLDWDDALDKDSVAAGIYEMWQRRLQANMRDLLVPKDVQPHLSLSTRRIVDWLTSPDGRFGADAVAGRDALLARSLAEAVGELVKKLGPDMNGWKYGQEAYHHARIEHPMSAAVSPAVRAKLEAGPLPRGGDGLTVSATGGTDNQRSGGSFKIIVDAENWDNAIGQNTPGQSGNPDDAHYRDLFALWANGRYFPVAYSRGKVESVTESRERLEPASSGDKR